MTNQEKLAKILRTKTKVILDMEKKMSVLTGKKGVVDKLVKENEKIIDKILTLLSSFKKDGSTKVFQSLTEKLKQDDRALYNLFNKPSGITNKGLKILFEHASSLASIKPLFVLKKEKAKEILQKNPPPNIMKALGYKNIDELLKKEDLIEIFCALRFVETGEWMHKTFDETYQKLKPSDFEKRKLDLRVLSGRWLKIAEKFVKKKYHNVSHLKELGVIFIIPLKIDSPGETVRLFSLILHYSHEVDFYSKLFQKIAKESDFGKKIISLLKGEVLQKTNSKQKITWLIIQRYLAKDDKSDKRLFIPHVNPEALHWQKAEQDIARLGRKYEDIDLEFWLELDWVGGLFKNSKGLELISFDLVDTVMSLVKKKQQIKYLYHQQEALWNEIFERYMGSKNLEKLMIKNFEKGQIAL